MSYIRPRESRILDNSQENQRRNVVDSVLLDKYINEKNHQIMSRLTNLMQYRGNVAQQLHQYYIRSLTQLQSSSSSPQPSGHQQPKSQTSKKEHEDLFFIMNSQCGSLEEQMEGNIKNGITETTCMATAATTEITANKKMRSRSIKSNTVRRQLFPTKKTV